MTAEIPENPPETIEKAKLEGLISDWRDTDNILEANDPKQYGKYEAADELEELING